MVPEGGKRTFAVNVFVRALATVRGVQSFHALATFETLPVPRLNIQRTLKVCGAACKKQWQLAYRYTPLLQLFMMLLHRTREITSY